MASRLRAAALGLLLAGFLTGCVSMPSGGPVVSYTVTQSPSGQSQAFIQQVPQAPQDGYTPTQIVQGFITASGSLGAQQTARAYLTPQFSKNWNRTQQWSATVYSQGPAVQLVSLSPRAKGHPQTAVVSVTGKVQAKVQDSGGYAVPSANKERPEAQLFTLVKGADGRWRISAAPAGLLLNSYTFNLDYQQRYLYFFDPNLKVLVPDPVYVPLQATPADLMLKLVRDLDAPPSDWLSFPAFPATRTAFPQGTKVDGVTLDGGTATVNLTGAAIGRAPAPLIQQVTSQVLSTLSGSGQGSQEVQAVELVVNGRPGDPVQAQPSTQPARASGVFYYLDSAGYLVEQDGPQGRSARFPIGKGYTSIAVSPVLVHGVRYVAALHGGNQGGGVLYTGPIGGKLVERGNGFTSMSWGTNDDLWATAGAEIFRLQGDANPAKPAGIPVPVNVVNYSSGVSVPEQFTALRVAPDGVRVAIIVGNGQALDFGAIATHQSAARSQASNHQPAAHPQPVTEIELSPFSVDSLGTTNFTAVTWYGPYNVITLGASGPSLTEYPVNGGGPTVIPQPPSPIQSITASAGNPLIVGVAKGKGFAMSAYAADLTGAWAYILNPNPNPAHETPVNGFSPVYSG